MSPDGLSSATETSEAIGAAATDATADPQAELTTDAAAAASGGDVSTAEGAPEGADAQTDAATAADDADLASYPESVREQFKSLSPEQRKSLYEHAEARVSERITAERERNDKLEAARKAEEDRRTAIRQKIGKYVGDEPVTKVGRDGVERVLPTLEETMRLNQNRKGRDELWDKYSLDEDGIEEHIESLNERRDMLDATTDLLEDRALGRIDGRMRDGFRAAELDPALLEQANAPEEIVPLVVKHLRAAHAAEMQKQKDEYEGRLAATNANAESMRGPLLAATSRTPATGGRSGGGGALTLEAFRALPRDERQKMRREQSALVDRLYAQGAGR